MIRRRSALSARRPLLENLEPRTLLSAALDGTVDVAITSVSSIKLASAIVTGTAVKGSLKTSIANLGTATSTGGGVAVYLRPAVGDEVKISTKPVRLPDLAPGKSKPFNIGLAVPTTLPAGDYTLVVIVINAADTTNENDIVTTPFTLSAAAGHVDLAGSLGALPSSIDVTGKNKTNLQINLSDSGNLPASGAATVTLKLHPAAGNDITVISKSLNLPKLKAAGGTGKFPNLPITLPTSVPAGTYTVEVTITPADATIAPITLNGPTVTIVSDTPPVTVTPTPPTSGSLLEHGNSVTFQSNFVTSTVNIETGTFVTSDGTTGEYGFSDAAITLTYSASDIQSFDVVPIGGFGFIDSSPNDNVGVTISFSANGSGAFFRLVDHASGATVGYGTRA